MDLKMEFRPDTLTADLGRDGDLLAVDESLVTAVIVSLFTDRRADPDDRVPGDATDRRGWWGDAVPPLVDGAEPDGDRIGSRLWLLSREKQLPEVVTRARDYAREALQWMIDDGVADRVDVTADIARPGVLALDVTLHRPDGATLDSRFDYAWEATTHAL